MSEKPISVGDLVVINRGGLCCGETKYLGLIFKVAAICSTKILGPCYACGKSQYVPHAQDTADGMWVELARLKRIPPLDELEGERIDETIKETA